MYAERAICSFRIWKRFLNHNVFVLKFYKYSVICFYDITIECNIYVNSNKTWLLTLFNIVTSIYNQLQFMLSKFQIKICNEKHEMNKKHTKQHDNNQSITSVYKFKRCYSWNWYVYMSNVHV